MKRNTFFVVLVSMLLGLVLFGLQLEVMVFSGPLAGFGVILVCCPALATLISLIAYFFIKENSKPALFYGVNAGAAGLICAAGASLYNALTESMFAGTNVHTGEIVRRTYENAEGIRVQYEWWSAKYIVIIIVAAAIAAALAYGIACIYKYCTVKKAK